MTHGPPRYSKICASYIALNRSSDDAFLNSLCRHCCRRKSRNDILVGESLCRNVGESGRRVGVIVALTVDCELVDSTLVDVRAL